MATKMFFRVDDLEAFYPFQTNHTDHLEWAAEDAAEKYHAAYDGWEDSWPVEIFLFESKNDEEPLGKFEVFRETVPQFHATKTEDCDTNE